MIEKTLKNYKDILRQLEGDSVEDSIQTVINTLVNILSEKIRQVDDMMMTANETIRKAEEAILNAVPGKDGESPDAEEIEHSIMERMQGLLPDMEQFAEDILTRMPRHEVLDEKRLVQKIVKALPESKASLKIIQERMEIDPMSVIEKILNLPEQKFKLSVKNIDGLEQTIKSFNSQLGKGYLHGGGDTVKAGTNIILVRNNDGTVTISSTGSGSATKSASLSSQCTGSNRIFTVPANSEFLTLIGSDAPIVYDKTTDFTGSGTTTLTLSSAVPAPSLGANLILEYNL